LKFIFIKFKPYNLIKNFRSLIKELLMIHKFVLTNLSYTLVKKCLNKKRLNTYKSERIKI